MEKLDLADWIVNGLPLHMNPSRWYLHGTDTVNKRPIQDFLGFLPISGAPMGITNFDR